MAPAKNAPSKTGVRYILFRVPDSRDLQVGSDFEDPIRLDDDDRTYVDYATPSWEEWLVFDPCDHIVQRPRGIQQNGSRAEIPIVHWRIGEHECAMQHAQE